MVFADKFAQAVVLIVRLATFFSQVPVLLVTDSWFGNNGLLKPLRARLGNRVHLLSRLRVNAALYALGEPTPGKAGRPRKYGERLGNAAELAAAMRTQAQTYTLHVYGALREVLAAEQVVMLKSLRCAVRVVWVYRKTQWVALMTTDLTLSVEQIIDYYAARWKIEAGFREIKQEIGSAHTQTRNPNAVVNHLHFCMAATAITWIYAARCAPRRAKRRPVVPGRRGRERVAAVAKGRESRSRGGNMQSASDTPSSHLRALSCPADQRGVGYGCDRRANPGRNQVVAKD